MQSGGGARSAKGGTPRTPQSRGLERLLGELEQEIMEVLWEWQEAAVREVLEELNSRRPIPRHLAYTTVMTVMSRLADKGLLRRRLIGRAHTYTVAQSRDLFLAQASDDLAHRMVEDFGEAAIASFVSVLQGVAPERLARLRRSSKARERPG
jgi:predicted transcriptional regulator